MDTFFEIVGAGAVVCSAIAAGYFAINRLVDHSLGDTPFQRLAKRVDELEAEIEETDRVAELNNSVIDETVDELDAADSRIDAQAVLLVDILKRLATLEAKTAKSAS